MKPNRRPVIAFRRSRAHLPPVGWQCTRRIFATVAVVVLFDAAGAAETATTVWIA